MPLIKTKRDLIWDRKHHAKGTVLNVNKAGAAYLLGTVPPSGEDVTKEKNAAKVAVQTRQEVGEGEDEEEGEGEA